MTFPRRSTASPTGRTKTQAPAARQPAPYALYGTKPNGYTHVLTGLSDDQTIWATCRDFWRDEEGYVALHVVANTGANKGERVTDTEWAVKGLPLRPARNPIRDARPVVIADEIAYVIRGTHADGRTIDLETLTHANGWTDRLTYWRTPGNAAPYDNDIHVATKAVVTTYTRLADPADHAI